MILNDYLKLFTERAVIGNIVTFDLAKTVKDPYHNWQGSFSQG